MDSKSEIRKGAIQRRNRMGEGDRAFLDQLIFERAHKQKAFQLSRAVHIYRSTSEEVDTNSLFEYAFALAKNVYAPISEHVHAAPRSCLIHRDMEWIVSKHGIMTPLITTETEVLESLPEDCTVIVPVVAFSPTCFRIGYGAGFYDKLLAGFLGPTIGLAYESQKVKEIPTESHDVPLSMIVTERHVYRKNDEE